MVDGVTTVGDLNLNAVIRPLRIKGDDELLKLRKKQQKDARPKSISLEMLNGVNHNLKTIKV